jgi:hypothetical protein
VVRALTLASFTDVETGCATFFANSDNRYGYRDLSHGNTLFGFTPQDAA